MLTLLPGRGKALPMERVRTLGRGLVVTLFVFEGGGLQMRAPWQEEVTDAYADADADTFITWA